MLDILIRADKPGKRSRMGERESHVALIAFKMAILLVAASSGFLALRSDRFVAEKPLEEDAYYEFTVSRNLAAGRGITEGSGARTNGFQPLWTFLIVPAFAVARHSRLLPLRYVTALDWALYFATACVLGLIARRAVGSQGALLRKLAPLASVLAYLSGTHTFLAHFNGLETGLLLFLIAVAWHDYQTAALDDWAGCTRFGLLLGLVVLARIDAVFLVIIVCVYRLLSARRGDWKGRLKQFALVSCVSFLVSSPWWLYNLFGFGSLLPSSGKAEQAWMISADRARLAFVALIRTAFPWVYAGRFGSLSIDLFRTLLAAAAVAVAWRALRSIRTPSGPAGKEAPCLERTLEFGGCLIAATLTLVVWYTLSSWATHFYSRYFAPIALVSALVGGVLVASWVQRRPRLAPVIAGALAMPVLFVACSACAGWYQDIGFVVRQFKLVQEYVPAEEWVAAGQTGTLAYFRDRTLNLDGKVNGAALA